VRIALRGGAVEGGEETVTGCVDLSPSIASQQPADDRVVPFNELAPSTVTECRRPLRGSDEIREEDGGKHSVELRFFVANS
jgi:hypothetical protein